VTRQTKGCAQKIFLSPFWAQPSISLFRTATARTQAQRPPSLRNQREADIWLEERIGPLTQVDALLGNRRRLPPTERLRLRALLCGA
jgi:hypothetical protein